MSSSTLLTQLAQRILSSAEKIDGGTADIKELGIARRELAEAAHELQLETKSTSEWLEQQQFHYQTLSCLAWLNRFDIFTHVPADLAPIAYVDLAAKAHVPIARLQSVARMAMTNGLFTEPSPKHIAHSRLSASFATDAHLRDWARFMTTYSAPTAAAFADATSKWGETFAKNESAFNVAFQTELPFFGYVKERDGMADEFAGYMRSQGRSEGGKLLHLVDGFDWAGLGDASVVDVGGSTGQASMALAAEFPGLKFTIQDLPEVITAPNPELGSLPASITSRLQFEPHDFFAPQPPQQGSAPHIYLLRKILHDWPADRAREILEQLAVALQKNRNPQARIVVMDTILPPPGTLGKVQEAGLRVRDLTMAQSFNAKERELGDWNHLFASTTPQLEIRAWKQPHGSTMAVMEVGILGEKY